MLLHELLRSFDPRIDLGPIPNSIIHGVKEDSRHVRPGDLFVGRPGTKANGATFLADAQRRGAVAAVVKSRSSECDLPQIEVAEPATAAGQLAQIFHGNPSHALRVLGITGTNGKTTTTYLIRHLLSKINLKCGVIGTVQIDDGRQASEAVMTTPAATDIAELLAAMRDNQCGACAIEVSSHALDQGRVAGVNFAAAAFTNLTGDHLDYHSTMENYAAAKARLFEMLEPSAIAAVNADDAHSDRMIRDTRGRIVRFGFGPKADYRAENLNITSQGSRFTLNTPGSSARVNMGLIGRHNVQNALTAAALAGEVFGISAQQLADALADAQGAPGRLQAIRAGQKFAVLVDYAHTDDALANVLSALRPLTTGTLRVVFGCGGDRDRTKRPRMAKTAEQLADVVYVTSDNPRTEMPGAIIIEIMAGFSADYRHRVIVEQDRRMAIERVLAEAEPGDVVLIAGKGHENYQIIGATKHHFDDVEEATRILGGRTRAA